MNPAEEAARRVSYQLTYCKSPTIRAFGGDTLNGDEIDNAYVSENPMSVGGWYDADWPSAVAQDPEPTVDDYIMKYARMALSEAIHESLEWIRVDGVHWLDPHSHSKAQAVVDATNEFFDRLNEIRHSTEAAPLREPAVLDDYGKTTSVTDMRITTTDGKT